MRRASELATLSQLLRASDAPGLRIAAVAGPGGVGKSYLLEEAFRLEDPRKLGFLRLSVDASNPQTRADFFGLVDGHLAARSLPEPARADFDYFPQLRKVTAIHRELVEKASLELARAKAPEKLRAAAAALFRAGHVLNKTIPKTRDLVDVGKIGVDDKEVVAALDAAWETIGGLDALRTSTALPGRLRDLLGVTARSRVRRDLHNFAADALCGDLAAILFKYQTKDALKLTHEPIPGFSRLLLVLDDFEAIAPVLSDFLLGSLFPRLAAAPYPSLVLIACRDDLEATHPGFGQHAKRWLVERLALTSFDRETAGELLAEYEVPLAKHESIYSATHGFPFLLTLAIEEASAPDADSVLFAKKFYDRTTRWMTERERSWFSALCYLDVINEDTIAAVLEDANAAEVQRWFEREASIRDPLASVFTVRPLIREKALRYLSTRSPSTHGRMVERARSSNAASSE